MDKSTIVIPVFNQCQLTAQCLDALIDQGHSRIVVVDDGSTDDTPTVLARYRDRIRVICHAENDGFSVSCNDGAAVAETDYVVFLNNDTVPREGWLDALEKYAAEHSAAAIVGARLLYPDNTVQHAGVVICQDRYPRHIYAGFPADHPAVEKSRRFQIVTAACMLVRREVFVGHGGFDAEFRNGFEDVDLCLRLGAAGREVHYCHESVVEHFESVSPQRFANDSENVALYRQRWLDRVRPDDLQYYLEDELFGINYEGKYPFAVNFSPLLATVDTIERGFETEFQLRQNSRHLAELRRENTRLRLELGAVLKDSPELQYQRLREQVIAAARRAVPADAFVLVVSKGDGSLLEMDWCHARHFPQTEQGAYAGHHPANSADAIAHLESLRSRGAEYLLIPETARWWLEHYRDFQRHLSSQFECVLSADGICLIYALRPTTDNLLQRLQQGLKEAVS